MHKEYYYHVELQGKGDWFFNRWHTSRILYIGSLEECVRFLNHNKNNFSGNRNIIRKVKVK